MVFHINYIWYLIVVVFQLQPYCGKFVRVPLIKPFVAGAIKNQLHVGMITIYFASPDFGT